MKEPAAPPAITKLVVAGAAIFLVALGVRLLTWQDRLVEIERGKSLLTALIKPYRQEARRMIEDGSLLFPRGSTDRGDARMIIHPPGYSILLRSTYGDEPKQPSYSGLRLFHVLCDSAAAVMTLLIAARLFPLAMAILSGLLAAVSPHLAHYSLWLSPDSLAALPILVALLLIARSLNRPSLAATLAAGAMLGLSCWLRSNALLLPLFLAPLLIALRERGKRLRSAIALVAAAYLVISPITIRNWVVYQSFIPLSVGSGVTLIEGIAEFDTEGRFDLPATDKMAAEKDAEWHDRPDYESNLWVPDGVERDRWRFARGVEVIRANPLWFFSVMLHRVAAMLRYNDSYGHGWAYHIAAVPFLSTDVPFGHSLTTLDREKAAWVGGPSEVMDAGEIVAKEARVALRTDGGAMRLEGDVSQFGDQFALAPIAVKKNTDYLLRISAEIERGPWAAKVTTSDRRITLGAESMTEPKKEADRPEGRELSESINEGLLTTVEVPFASGERDEVRLVLSNDGGNVRPTLMQLGVVELFELGDTPHMWSRLPRSLIRGLQKNIFTTDRMLALIAIGITLIALARRGRTLLLLLAVPAYYLITQSALHTEYRYVLTINYFLSVIAATTLYCVGIAIWQGARWTIYKMRQG